MGRAKKKHEQNAELAYSYHIDPFTLTVGQRVGLIANLEKMRARERIRTGDYNQEDFEGVYNLYMIAYGDEQRASAAMERAAEFYADQEIRRAKTK